MRHRPLLLILGPCCLWVAAGAAATGRPHVQAVPASYPPGKGRDVVIRVCGDCHAVTDITRRRESRYRWAVIVNDMLDQGAKISDADFETSVAYLSVVLGRTIRINTAAADVIAEAFDISEAEAAAIVKHRLEKGPFRTWQALAAVPGVDPRRIEEQRGNLDFTTGGAASP